MSSYEENPFQKSRLARIFGFVERLAGKQPELGRQGGWGATVDPLPEDIEARRQSAEVSRKPPPDAD